MDKEIEKIRKRRRNEQRAARISEVVSGTGWTEEKALEEMDYVRKNFKISFGEYSRYQLFQYDKEKLADVYQTLLAEEKREKKKKEESDALEFQKYYVEKVMERTGWPEALTKENIEKARQNVGCTYKRYFHREYFLYRMYELGADEQKEIMIWDDSRKISQMYNVNKSFTVLTNNKEESNTYFHKFMKRAWCLNRNITSAEFLELFRRCEKIIYKPLKGHMGGGIEVYEINDKNAAEIYRELMELPEGVIEEYVIQHHILSQLCKSSLNTLRIVTITSKSMPVTPEGAFTDIVYIAIRIGGGTAVVDNLHAGGMVVLIDLQSGITITDGGDAEGNIYKTHPVSGATIKGVKIPFFEETKRMVYEMCSMESVEGYLGWDIGITENGPVLIEVNANPGIDVLSTAGATEKKGMKYVMEQYIQGNRLLEKYEIKKPDYHTIDRTDREWNSSRYPAKRYIDVKYEGIGNSWEKRDAKSGNKAVVLITGDITCMEKQIETALCSEKYDFDASFDVVKSIFAQSDLAMGNLETMIYPAAPYRNEKYVSEQNFHCNAPVEFLHAFRKSGIDLLTNANNHDLDTGAVGIGETIDHIRRFGFIQTGTFKDHTKRYVLLDINRIKVAVIAFATEHNKKEYNLTAEGKDFLLNTYSEEKAEKIIKEARADGAEAVLVCIHWGQELKDMENKVQQNIAGKLAELGADCIIGSHPHVLQPFRMMEYQNKKIPVFYSLGNFISHNTRGAKSRSIIACIDIQKQDGNIQLGCTYIPVHTAKSYHGHKFVVLPISKDTEDETDQKRLKIIERTLGKDIALNKDIAYQVENEDKIEDGRKVIGDKFLYENGDGYVRITGLDSQCNTLSYSMPAEIDHVPVREISSMAFQGNQVMKKINFGKNIEYVSEQAFKDCSMLEGFQLGKSISEIKYEAFANCLKLSCAVMGNQVKKIASRAFANCRNMMSVKISAKMESIADDAFEGCGNIVFYCPAGSYAEKYANRHGFQVIHMQYVSEPGSRRPEKVNTEVNKTTLEAIFEGIDRLDTVESVENFISRNSINSLNKAFWSNRKIALSSADELERSKALAKCKCIERMFSASIPVKETVKKFTAPHGLAGISISTYAKVGTGCTIFQHVTIGSNTIPDSKNAGFPVIGNNVYIGAGASIIGNVHIGNNCRIGAGCIVVNDVPDHCVVYMNGPVVKQKQNLNNKFITAANYKKRIKKA